MSGFVWVRCSRRQLADVIVTIYTIYLHSHQQG